MPCTQWWVCGSPSALVEGGPLLVLPGVLQLLCFLHPGFVDKLLLGLADVMQYIDCNNDVGDVDLSEFEVGSWGTPAPFEVA